MDYTNPYHEAASEYLKLYQILQEKGDDWPFPYDFKTPDTFALVEDYVSKLVQSFTAVDPIIAIQKKRGITPKMMKVGDQVEIVLQTMFQYPEGMFFEEFENWIRQSAIFGTGFMFPTPVFKANGYLDHVRFEVVDFWDVVPDPRATSVMRANYILLRRIVSREYVLANKGVFPEFERNPTDTMSALYPAIETDYRLRYMQETGKMPFIPEDDEVELFYIFDQSGFRILANRMAYLADTKTDSLDNPFCFGIPIEDFRLYPQIKEFFGIGIPYIVKDLQRYRDELRSKRATNHDLLIAPPFKVKINADLDPLATFLLPGAAIPVSDSSDIEPMPFPDTTASSYREDIVIQADMEQATSMSKAARGLSETKRQTGKEILRLQQAGLSRIDVQMKRMEQALRRLARRVLVYIHEYMDPAEYEQLIGEPDAGFFELSMTDILRYWQLQPVGSAVSSIKEIRQQRQSAVFQVLTAIPPEVASKNLGGQKPFAIDYHSVLLDLLAANEVPNPHRYIIEPQQSKSEPEPEPVLPGPGQGQGQPDQRDAMMQQLLMKGFSALSEG